MTNFVAALAQTEAAMEIFRDQEAGHLVMVSSMSAMRGMPKTLTTYAATKVGVAHLAEGLRSELYGTPLAKKIKVTVLYPGYIASEMNEKVAQSTPMMISTEKGVKLDGLRDREAGRRRLRARAALGAAVRGDEARPAAGPQAPRCRPRSSRSGARSAADAGRRRPPASVELRQPEQRPISRRSCILRHPSGSPRRRGHWSPPMPPCAELEQQSVRRAAADVPGRIDSSSR